MGFFDIPVVNRKPTGWLALGLCILGGIGTIVIGVMEKRKNVWQLGIIQLVVAIVTIGIGIIWGIVWGILVFMRSTSDAAPSTSTSPAATASSKPAAKTSAASPGKTADKSDAEYQPQCSALTADGQQCRNSTRGVSRYCAPHKGYQPPTAKGLAKRIEGDSWDAKDKLTDRKSIASSDTRPVVRKAQDTQMKVRKSPKKAGKKPAKKTTKK